MAGVVFFVYLFLVWFFSVLEACGACGQDLSTEELWQKVLQEVTVEDLQAPLHRLGALQAAWWLAARRLGSTAGLFRLLSKAEVPGHGRMQAVTCTRVSVEIQIPVGLLKEAELA